MNIKIFGKAWLCLCLAQLWLQHPVNAQALKPGDPVPPELWDLPLQVVNHPGGKKATTLREYKDKLIIVDFWATWCAPCVKSLTQLDSLQKEFGEQLVVVPITYENPEKVLPMYKKRGWSLMSVVEDTLVKKYFPFRVIPHQVWIKEGALLSQTGHEYATSENILALLRGEVIKMRQKADKMQTIESDTSSAFYYRSGIKGRIRGANSKGSIRSHYISTQNSSLRTLLAIAHSGLYARKQWNEMLVWDVSDSLKNELCATGPGYTGDFVKDSLYDRWLDDNLYCYSIQFNEKLKISREQLYAYMREDILRFLRLHKGVEVIASKSGENGTEPDQSRDILIITQNRNISNEKKSNK